MLTLFFLTAFLGSKITEMSTKERTSCILETTNRKNTPRFQKVKKTRETLENSSQKDIEHSKKHHRTNQCHYFGYQFESIILLKAFPQTVFIGSFLQCLVMR